MNSKDAKVNQKGCPTHAIARIIRRDKNKFASFLDALFGSEEEEELQKTRRRKDKYTYFSNLCEGTYNL